MEPDRHPNHVEVSDWIPQLDRILRCISHDLKNPLSIIRGNAQLAMLVNSDQKIETCLNRIIDAVDDINDDLKEVNCLQKSRNTSMTTTALDDVLRDTLRMLQPQIEGSGIVKDFHIATGIDVVINKAHVTTALKHIIKNAVDAMPEGGVLTVSLASDADFAYVIISDTGKGIGPEVKTKLFREVISTRQGARGLGLILADQVVRVSHGGELTFCTNSQGTTFTVKLPLRQSQTEAM